jgi:beta-lactamase superfamily II metal-dependent hydrolase
MPYEIDFLSVGDGQDSGDAISLRFTDPQTGQWRHVIVDAGFADDGDALVEHVLAYYGTDQIDLAILTHPDGDHIGGMGRVVRRLSVANLWLHDIGSRGGATLPAGAAVDELIDVASQNGTRVSEAWAGDQAFGGAVTILGPDQNYYTELVQEQIAETSAVSAARRALVEAARGIWDRVSGILGDEIPFPEKEVSPRNNSSMITLLQLEGQTALLSADAGVPALQRAWDVAEQLGISAPPEFVQIPHHGSRRNASSAWLDRLLGPTGQTPSRTAFVSVVADSDKHPSGRVVNAYMRRGCTVLATAGSAKSHRHNTPPRPDWSPATPLDPMIEEDEED